MGVQLGMIYISISLLRKKRDEPTGRRARYASNEAPAARMNTDLRLAAYESLAMRCATGGRTATYFTERWIFFIN